MERTGTITASARIDTAQVPINTQAGALFEPVKSSNWAPAVLSRLDSCAKSK